MFYLWQNGIKRAICYASRWLRLSKKLHSAHKLKFLCLKWAVTDKLHDYLYGNLFEVRINKTRSLMSQLHIRQIATGSLVIRIYLGSWHLQLYVFPLSLVVSMLVLNIYVHEEGSFLLYVMRWGEVRRLCPCRTGSSAFGQHFLRICLQHKSLKAQFSLAFGCLSKEMFGSTPLYLWIHSEWKAFLHFFCNTISFNVCYFLFSKDLQLN